MKVCIYGAGAIGGFIGTRLAAAGECAGQRGGARRHAAGAARRTAGACARAASCCSAPVAAATEDPRELGAQDLVVVAVKGPALAEVARAHRRRCWAARRSCCRR